mmetsp:Transcript_40602/g.94291  ORF Transcript_40602/g.94291 Transcript_40602/m.94291 type:complete len:432 (+) Transcript_40602:81-1376(+)
MAVTTSAAQDFLPTPLGALHQEDDTRLASAGAVTVLALAALVCRLAVPWKRILGLKKARDLADVEPGQLDASWDKDADGRWAYPVASSTDDVAGAASPKGPSVAARKKLRKTPAAATPAAQLRRFIQFLQTLQTQQLPSPLQAGADQSCEQDHRTDHPSPVMMPRGFTPAAQLRSLVTSAATNQRPCDVNAPVVEHVEHPICAGVHSSSPAQLTPAAQLRSMLHSSGYDGTPAVDLGGVVQTSAQSCQPATLSRLSEMSHGQVSESVSGTLGRSEGHRQDASPERQVEGTDSLPSDDADVPPAMHIRDLRSCLAVRQYFRAELESKVATFAQSETLLGSIKKNEKTEQRLEQHLNDLARQGATGRSPVSKPKGPYTLSVALNSPSARGAQPAAQQEGKRIATQSSSKEKSTFHSSTCEDGLMPVSTTRVGI